MGSSTDYKKLIEAKKKAKSELFARGQVGKRQPVESGAIKMLKEQPLVLIFAEEKHQKLLFNLLQGCLVLPGHIIVISDCEPADFEKNPAGKITFVNKNEFARDASSGSLVGSPSGRLMAADMAVVFDGYQQNLQDIMRQGIVVIGHEKLPLLQNYHPNEETGNSFTFDSFNPWSVFMALVRAHETYRFPYDWMNIVRGIVKKI